MKKQIVKITPLPPEKRSEFFSAYDYAQKYHLQKQAKEILRIFEELYEKGSSYKTIEGKIKPLLQMMKPFPAKASLYMENNKEALQAMEGIMEERGIGIEFPISEYIKASGKNISDHWGYIRSATYINNRGEKRKLFREAYKVNKSGRLVPTECFVTSSSKEAIQKLNDLVEMLEIADKTGSICVSIADFARFFNVGVHRVSERYPGINPEILKKMYLNHVCHTNAKGEREPLVNLGWDSNGQLKIGVPAKKETINAFLYFQGLYARRHYNDLQETCDKNGHPIKKEFFRLPEELGIFGDIHEDCAVYTDKNGDDLPVVSDRMGLAVENSRRSLRALMNECEKRGIPIQLGDLQKTEDCRPRIVSSKNFTKKLRRYYKKEKTNS